MNRRQLIAAGLAWPLAPAPRASAQRPVPIGDMHAHFFFDPQGRLRSAPVAGIMAAGGATLVAWSLVGDLLWMGPSPRGYVQTSEPKAGDTLGFFQRELARIKRHVAEQGLKIVRDAADVDRAVQGEPHVVLAVEGASFIEGDPFRLQMAYDLGVRHLQLVHYIKNTLADFQTVQPEHNGMSALGRTVVEECNRLGILIDLAHCTAPAVAQALAASRVPMVWSHSSVTRARQPHWSMVPWQARQLSLEGARSLAAKGGVVGLWALLQDVGGTIGDYADRLTQMAEWLGEDHVAFGTDLNGLGPNAIIADYAGVRRVIEHWQQRGVGEPRIRKLAIENYARVLQQALRARSA